MKNNFLHIFKNSEGWNGEGWNGLDFKTSSDYFLSEGWNGF